MKADVVIMGLGYIGLPTAAILANKGLNVWGVDINDDVVQTINRGEIHIFEPDLKGMVAQAVQSQKLQASTKIIQAKTYLVVVPTPF